MKIGAKYCASSTIYADLLEAFGKLDSAGRRAIVSYLKTQTTVSQFRSPLRIRWEVVVVPRADYRLKSGGAADST